MDIVLIDDEKRCHVIFERLISKHYPSVNIIAQGFSVEDGMEIITNYDPDVVFLDIKMKDGTGFDLLQKIGKPNFHVIFVTAFEEYAKAAIQFGGLDYIVKPITRISLANALRKAKETKGDWDLKKQLEIALETIERLKAKMEPTRIGIPTTSKNGGISVDIELVENIIRLEAQKNYTEFFIKGDRRILASRNIGHFERQFDLFDSFIRIHRAHIINLRYIKKYIKSDGGYIVLKNNEKISVSDVYKKNLKSSIFNL